MPVTRLRWLTPFLLLAGTLPAAAQSAPRPAAGAAVVPLASPLDAGADVPRIVHRSSLGQYRRLADEPLASWREANDTVNRIGGWRAYAREASQAEGAAAPQTAASAAGPAAAAPPVRPGSAPTATGGHKKH